ncbi:hypothetical protein SBOR_1223 [Sclerotinia borealis F-4128]|uniref:Uncharacterized protein n=1 Tax=Sclerotinia borealis (strain F-4128) TaxID=1432307 RepID=W9CV16_SCLBF|nr:hypothetical protein SBOR_1223 [Sclerotinia borealis F-4128]
MAPMREESEQYMDHLVQSNVVDALPLVKKDGEKSDNGSDENGERHDDSDDEYYGDGRDTQVDDHSVSLITRTAWTQVTDTAWTTQTATVWTTQTAVTTSSSVMTVVIVATPTSTTKSPVSTSISITSALIPTTTTVTAFGIPSSEQPGRKGLCTLSNGFPCESGSATTSTVTAYEAISANSAPTAQADQSSSLPTGMPPQSYNGKPHNDDDDGDLSPLAEKLLIGAGSIGIFVIFGAIIYLIIRMKKLNRLARGEISEEEARWYGWRRNRDDPGRSPSYASGKVSRNGYPIEEKFAEREMAGFYNSDNKVALERPGSAAVNLRELRTDLQRQNSTRSSQSGSGLSPSPGQSYGLLGNADNYYSQSGTLRSQQSGLSGQSSNAYNPSQREVNHISYLSSISSGFGDSLVMLDDSAPPQNPVSRFSWTTASQGAPQNRDTIYTTTSEETSPRFRTVNSWVAQQTGRVERKQQSDMEIPAMPEIPILYTHRSQVPEPLFTEGHQRMASENQAFRHHPGDEIELGRGSRVPSSILDKRVGV